jgi:hypothetical protein
MENVYLNQVHKNLPRILSLFDNDLSSASYGFGDRFHWAWGLSDFANGTYQGAAHGFARLWVAGLWPYPTSKAKFLERINSLFIATGKITRKNGSLEEAFPNEGSYCVTALVAFDLLCALDLLKDTVDRRTHEQWKNIIKPLIEYLLVSDERHALISNHLATAVAALFRWYELTSDVRADVKAKTLLDRIVIGQSSEGWFSEYGGFDPGYQSLATYYLADIYFTQKDLHIRNLLEHSLEFLKYFIHPDGSIGGSYGSRCTRFYAPGGITALSSELPLAKKICSEMSLSIKNSKVVGLSEIDESNLIPFFNSYCWAASIFMKELKNQEDYVDLGLLPNSQPENFSKFFKKAGILVSKSQDLYYILNIKKGGIIYAFEKQKCVKVDCGVVFSNKKNMLGSTNFWDPNIEYKIEDDKIIIKSRVVAMPKKLPTPIEFLVIRILSLTFFRSYWAREYIKNLLVEFLITKKIFWPVKNTRKIVIGGELKITDDSDIPNGYSKVEGISNFVPIHMASKGYWQIQDEDR